MIRQATTEDTATVIDLVVAAGMFSADDAWLVEGLWRNTSTPTAATATSA